MATRNFKAKRIYQRKASTAPEDFYRLDPKKSPKENAYDIYVALSLRDTSDTKRLNLLNEFVTLLQQNKDINLGFTTDELLFCLSASLTHSFTQVRAAALRTIRYVLSSPKDLQIFNALQIQHLVCRSIDFMLKVDDERVQALKLIRKMLAVSADYISPILVRCLVSMGDFGIEDNDRMLRACLATLCELGVLNPTLLIVCGGVGTITRNILECHSPRISESLCGVLLYLLEYPHTRNIAGIRLDCLAAPYCDFTYRLGIMDKNKDARELRYTSSRLALLSVLKSWTGILEFCDPSRPSGLKAVVDILYLNQLDVRKAILDLFYELIGLPQIIWTDEYSVALSLVDPSDFQDAWLLNNGFVAMEGRCILPSLANRVPNICEQNLAIILYSFLETGLLSALVEVIVTSDTYISVRATILVGKLLHLMHTLLPADICSTCQALPTLISYAAQGNNQANAAINALQNYHQMLKNRPASSSLFLDLIIRSGALSNSKLFKRDVGLGEYFNASGTFEERRRRLDSNASSLSGGADESYVSVANNTSNNTSGGPQLTRMSSFRMKRIRRISQYFDQIREFEKMVKESRVVSQEDSNKWDWDVVSTMLKSEAMSGKLDDSKIRFLKRLVTFYKPTSFKFSHQDLPIGKGVPSVVTAGLDLIDWLLASKDLESMRLLTDLFSDVKTQLLEISTSNRAHDCLFSPQHMNSTMCQQYFVFIGRMCRTEKGLGVLVNNGVFQQLTEIVKNTYHVCYIKLIISGLDYTLTSFARKILEQALTVSSLVTARLYATQFLLVLLRARLPNFEVWGIPLIIKQTMDKKKSIVIAAMEILDEACNEKDYLEEIIQKWPNLSHLEDMGTLLMSRYYSLSRGLNSPHAKVKKEIEYWKNTFNKRYVLQIEADVHSSLTLHIKNEDGFYSRRNCSTKPIIFPPNIQPHLYGQLAQTEQGMGELRKYGGLSNLIETIIKGKCSDENESLELKAALWAIGHCSTHSNGIEFLKDPLFRIYERITTLASTAEVYSIRAVAFSVLGLVASTNMGATLLFKLGWLSIRHDRSVQWPVYQPEDWNPNNITPIRHHFDEVPPYNYKGIDEHIDCFNASSDSNSYFLDEQVESKGSSSKDEQSDGQTTQNQLVSSKSKTLPEHSTLRNFRHKRSLSESKTSDDMVGIFHTTPHQQQSHRTRFNSGTDSNTSGVSSCESVLGRNIYSDLQQTPLSPIPSTSNLLEVNKEYHRFSTDNSFRFLSLSPQDIKGYATLRSIKRHYRPVLSESAADDIADIIDLNEITRPARHLSFSEYQRKIKVRSLDRQSSNQYSLPLKLDEYQVPIPSLTTPKLFSQADSKGPIYAGISLPKNIMDLFPHHPTPYKTYISQDIQDQDLMDINLLTAKQEYLNDSLNAAGTSVMSSLSDVSSVSKQKPTKWIGKHSRGHCLQCSRLRFNKNASEISILRSSIQLSDLSFNSPESILSDDNMPDRVSAQILQGVQRLANPVCGKQAQNLLLELKQKHSTSFQDICLFSEVSKTLGRSTFRMPARRFIQELFMDLNFDSFFFEPNEIILRKDKDTLSSACSTINDDESRDFVDGIEDFSSASISSSSTHVFPAPFKSHIKSPPLESVYETSYENLTDSLPKTNSLTSSSTTTTTTKVHNLYRNQNQVNHNKVSNNNTNSSDSSIIVVDENKRNSSSGSMMENENKKYTRGRFYTLELDLSCTKNKFPITERRKREFSTPSPTTSTPAAPASTTSQTPTSTTITHSQFTFTKSLSSSLAKPIGSLYCEKRLQSSKSEAVLSKNK